MGQDRIHDYRDPAVTTDLNEKIDLLLVGCVLEGMQVSPYGTWSVAVGSGSWLCDGVVIKETTSVSTPLSISPPSTQDRIDVVYGQYTYQPTSPPPEATYGIAQGVPGTDPQPPTLESYQVKIAEIYVPATASSISDCTIRNVYTLKEQLQMLLGIKIEGNLWVRSSDPVADDNEKVEDGDFWLDTDTKTLYVWDAATQTWVAPTVPAHAPTHQAGGVDELDVSTLADANNYLHPSTKDYHDSLHLDHAQLSNVQPDQHHARDHASRHMPGGGDELPWGHGGGTNADMVDGMHASEFATVNHTHTGYAASPHGNEEHFPTFAEEGHQHPLSDITGTISKGYIAIVDPPDEPVPTGSLIHEERIPDFSITGTTVQITGFRAHVATAPTANITFTVKINGSALGQVTIPANSTSGSLDLSPAQAVAAGDILQVDGPADGGGAKGLDLKILLARVQG